ncbi:MAG: sigma-70 family RNA polymerase sigma factor [Pirellulales bacterium]
MRPPADNNPSTDVVPRRGSEADVEGSAAVGRAEAAAGVVPFAAADPSADRGLAGRLATGDSAAWQELFTRYGDRLYRAAARWTGRPADAEDIVQELFVALVRTRERLSDVEQWEAYLFAALRRQIIDHARRRAVRPTPGALRDQPAPAAALGDEHEERRARLTLAVAQLPDEQREVVVWKIDGELTFRQIAELIGISPHTAASRYRYALEKLRTILGES